MDVDLSEEFLRRSDSESKETPENRAEKVQEMLMLLNGEYLSPRPTFAGTRNCPRAHFLPRLIRSAERESAPNVRLIRTVRYAYEKATKLPTRRSFLAL